jgi:molecular chaperone DnaK (HSP70)
MSKVYFGIDLGTSSSSISYVVDSRRTEQNTFIEPTTVRFSPPPGAVTYHNWQRLPSMVYIEQKGGRKKAIAGFQAEEAAAGKLAKTGRRSRLTVAIATYLTSTSGLWPAIVSK